MELLAAIVILGILATLAMGAFRGRFADCQYRKTAEKTLRGMLAAEKQYYLANQAFTSDVTQLPVEDPNMHSTTAGGNMPLTYSIQATTASQFLGTAKYLRPTPQPTLTLQYDPYANQSNSEPGVTWIPSGSWCP